MKGKVQLIEQKFSADEIFVFLLNLKIHLSDKNICAAKNSSNFCLQLTGRHRLIKGCFKIIYNG